MTEKAMKEHSEAILAVEYEVQRLERLRLRWRTAFNIIFVLGVLGMVCAWGYMVLTEVYL